MSRAPTFLSSLLAIVLLGSTARADDAPAPALPIAATDPAPDLARIQDVLRGPGVREARLRFDAPGKGTLALITLAADVPFTTMIVVLEAWDEGGRPFTTFYRITAGGSALWKAGETHGLELVWDLEGVARALVGDDVKTLRPCMSIQLTPSDGARPHLTFGMKLSSHDDVASWFEDIRHAEGISARRGPDEVEFSIPAERRTITLDSTTGFFRSMEVTQPDGERFVLSCEDVVLHAGLPDLPMPDTWDVRPAPFEELVSMVRPMLAEMPEQDADASRAGACAEGLDIARRGVVASLTAVLAQHQLRALACEVIDARPTAGASPGEGRDPRVGLEAEFLGKIKLRRAMLERTLVRSIEELFPGQALDLAAGAERAFRRPHMVELLREELRRRR
jgi:hypothetical protein